MSKRIPSKLLNTHILNSCFSKAVYATEAEAQKAARKIASDNSRKRENEYVKHWSKAYEMEVYHCGFCKNYHLTNSSQKNWNNNNIDVTKIKLRQTSKKKPVNKNNNNKKNKKNKKKLKK